jgi:drug/metabolite transporter (DMT)-like permease
MRHRGELLAALAAMGFGSAYVATAFALRSFEPVPAAAWRSALATAAVVLVVAVRHLRARRGEDAAAADPAGERPTAVAGGAPGERPSPAARAVRLLVLGALAGPIFLASMSFAVAGVGATIAAFVAGLYAVLAAVIAPFLLSERLAARSLGGLVLALVGTALLAELDPAGADAAGMAWGLLAAASFAVYLVLARRWSACYDLDGLDVALGALSLSTVVLGGCLLVADPASLRPSDVAAEALVAIGWMAAVAALSPVLMVASVRLIPAARSAAFLLLNPITATVLAAALLGERPAPVQLLGGLLVLIGIAVATRPADVHLGRILARVRA